MHLQAPTSLRRRCLLFGTLAAAMLATRAGHVAGLPDASWAVFFLGGLYFGGWPAFAALAAEAAGLDALAIQHYGVSAYCVTVAYALLPVAYGALWLGGQWSRRALEERSRHAWVSTAGSLLVATTTCYLVSDLSFYWLGGRVTDPSFGGWAINAAHWYPRFLWVTCAYVVGTLAVHLALARISRARWAAATPLAE